MAERPKTPPEQVTYANLLFYGSWAAIAILLITYVIYCSGVLDTYVPMEKLQHYWSRPVAEYVHEANIPLGWGWATLLGKGDFLNFVGIVLLAGMTIICFLVVLPSYIKEKDILYVVIVVLEVLVLAAGASGFIGAGAH
jgi:phosphoglycerol transferase MdoB-like AlkP superfamily enzyme